MRTAESRAPHHARGARGSALHRAQARIVGLHPESHVGLLDGGIRTFAGSFWTPLHTAWSLAAGQPFQHQLVVVVTDVAPDPTAVSACAPPPGDTDLPDYSKPLRLSRLDLITRTQLLTWLA